MLAGAGLSLFDVWWQTALAQRIPPHALSRVSSYDWMGSLALLPLGYLLAGPIGEAIGPAEVLIVGGAVGVAIAALGFAIPDVWRLRALPTGVVVDSVNTSVLPYLPLRRPSVSAIDCLKSTCTTSLPTGAG